jgi:hypothetical protein
MGERVTRSEPACWAHRGIPTTLGFSEINFQKSYGVARGRNSSPQIGTGGRVGEIFQKNEFANGFDTLEGPLFGVSGRVAAIAHLKAGMEARSLLRDRSP